MKRPLLLALMSFQLSSCSMLAIGKQNLSVSPSMPASEGTVKFKQTKDKNTAIVVNVKHLAHPEKLTPPATTYVVWVRKDKDSPAQNVGALTVDKQLNGSLATITPLQSFDLFVTAEGAGAVQAPTGQQMLWASYSR